MPPSIAAEPVATAGTGTLAQENWRRALAPLALSWAALLLGFAHDWLTIFKVAWNSSTFNHILLMPPILAALVGQRLPELARIAPRPWWPGLLISAAGALAWLLGAVSGLDVARQFGAVLMLVSTVPLLLGVRVSAVLAFPLAYALLLVPIGEELVPALQMVTAKITVQLVEVSGVPAAIDGVFIETPAGLFEVAEACSGVKFLIAMLALGLLVANVCFRSWRRRVVFLAACAVVPILANGVRAFATIYVAQIVGAEKAVGFDHIVYGWIFFACVVALLLAGAWRYFDRPAGDPMIDAAAIDASPVLEKLSRLHMRIAPALAVLALIVAGAQVWARAGNSLAAQVPERIALPPVKGWTLVPYQPELPWEPRAQGADRRLLGRYQDARGRQVDVFLALYSAQGEGREAGGFGQGALTPHGGWSWHSPGPSFGVGNSELLRGDNGDLRLAVTWYRSGNALTGSNARLKARNMADRLMLRAEPTAMLIVSAVARQPEPPAEAIRAFSRDIGPPAVWIDHVTRVR